MARQRIIRRVRRIRQRATNIISSVANIFFRILRRPQFLIACALAYLIYSQDKNSTESFLYHLKSFTESTKISAIKTVGAWLYTNSNQTVQLTYGTGIISTTSPSTSFAFFILFSLFIIISKPPFQQTFVALGSSLLYLKLRTPSHRYAVLLCIIVAYIYGYLD